MVVDLAVEDDLDRAVLVRDRLVPGRAQIDQCEPAVNQLAVRVTEMARAIGTAMLQQAVGIAVPAIVVGESGGAKPPGDPAHQAPPMASR